MSADIKVKSIRQLKPTKLAPVGESQCELFPSQSRKRFPRAIDLDHLIALPTEAKVVKYCIECGDIADNKKELIAALGTDKGTWSKIENGSLRCSPAFIDRFCEFVGNDGLKLWYIHNWNFDPSSLRLRSSPLERQLESEREKCELLEKENDGLTAVIQRQARKIEALQIELAGFKSRQPVAAASGRRA